MGSATSSNRNEFGTSDGCIELSKMEAKLMTEDNNGFYGMSSKHGRDLISSKEKRLYFKILKSIPYLNGNHQFLVKDLAS